MVASVAAYASVCSVALFAAGVSLYSGFGLGTVLVPALALFFPVEVAVAAAALVHLANNGFKIVLVGRHADWGMVVRFGLPAAPAAIAGAATLGLLGEFPPLATYAIGGRLHAVTPVKLTIGLLIVAFAVAELVPRLAGFTFDRRHVLWGGLLSGYFGGLSGSQGALRSAFLMKSGLDKEAFLGTGVVCAVLVDGCRLAVYGATFGATGILGREGLAGLVAAATAAVFIGSFLAARLLRRISLRAIHLAVGALLVLLGCGMAAGLL